MLPTHQMGRTRSSTIGWSPEKNLWNELIRVSKNLSWKKIKLDLSSSHRVSKQIGVYLICACHPYEAVKGLKAYTVLYTGQVKSEDRGLRTRFLEHIKKPNAKLKLYLNCYYPDVHFWFAHVDKPTQIDELEALLVETFNPPCNSIGAPGSSALVARLGTPRFIGRNNERHLM